MTDPTSPRSLKRAWAPGLDRVLSGMAQRASLVGPAGTPVTEPERLQLVKLFRLRGAQVVDAQGEAMVTTALLAARDMADGDKVQVDEPTVFHWARLIWQHSIVTLVLTDLGIHATDDDAVTLAEVENTNMDTLVERLLGE